MASSSDHGSVDIANEETILPSDGLVHEGELTCKSDANGIEPLIKEEDVDAGKGIDGGTDAKASVIEGIIESHSESGPKKKRKNKNKKKRNNKVAEVDSNTNGGGVSGQVSENFSEKDNGTSVSGSTSEITEILKDICHEISSKDEADSSSHVSIVENPSASGLEFGGEEQTEALGTKSHEPLNIPSEVVNEDAEPTEPISTLANTGSIENVDMNLKPSVKFIFQSEGKNPIHDNNDATYFIESETSLAEELKVLSVLESQPDALLECHGHSEGSISESPVTATSNESEESNDYPDLKEQVAVGNVSLDLLEADDVSNNNYLQSDSRDFENGQSVRNDVSVGSKSNVSIKIPTAPNPSLDTVANPQSKHDQMIVSNISAVGQAITDFLNDRPGWKTQNPKFVDQDQTDVDKVLDNTSINIQELVNFEDSLIEKETQAEALPHTITKSSDSMNNLYQVEGDNEYPNEGVLSDFSLDHSPEHDTGPLTMNGVGFELIEPVANSDDAEKLEIQESQGFITGLVSDEEIEQDGQEYAASGEIYYSPSTLPAPPSNEDGVEEISSENDSPAFSSQDGNSESGRNRSETLVTHTSDPSHTSEWSHNEEFFYAMSHVESECQDSPGATANLEDTKSSTEAAQEIQDMSARENILQLEVELEQVVASGSKLSINKSPQIQKGSGILDDISCEENVCPESYTQVVDANELLVEVRSNLQEKVDTESGREFESVAKADEKVLMESNENKTGVKLSVTDAVPLPLENVQQIYNRQQREETKCATLRRGLPCFATKSNSGESITDAFLESMNNQHFRKDDLTEGQDPSPRNSLERGLTRGRAGATRVLTALQRWKTASIRRFSRPPNH